MNELILGTADKTPYLVEKATPPFLLIDDGPVANVFRKQFKAKTFDTEKHSLNPLRATSYKDKCDLLDTILATFPAGQNTLTKEGVPVAFFDELEKHPKRLDKMFVGTFHDPSYISAQRMIKRILYSPVLNNVLLKNAYFTFEGNVLVVLDRAVIGDFDAFLLGSLLIGQHKGQVIVPDFGFYGRNHHIALIRQHRLLAGLKRLSELPDTMHLTDFSDVVLAQASREDAETVADYGSLAPGTTGHTGFLEDATSATVP